MAEPSGLERKHRAARPATSASMSVPKTAVKPAGVKVGEHFPRGLQTLVELVVIGLWVLWIGRPYLNLDPQIVPAGNEYGMLTQSNHFWTQVQKCGWCALWNGSEQGGIPALVDIHGDMLHPVVALATLIFGVVNGSKISLLVALWIAGTAQWWIAREMNLSALPRLFTAGIAAAGGDLASRMQTGSYISVLATAMASLVVASFVHLWRRGGPRATVLFGIILAAFLVSGQGYVQLAMIGVAPAALFLICGGPRRPSVVGKELALSIGLSLALAAPLLVPLLNFSPHLGKGTDPAGIHSAQPLQYLPLNLVIRDAAFYFQSGALGRFTTADLYALYIGWVPVVLAGIGLGRIWRLHRSLALFLASGASLAFVVASGVIQQQAEAAWPSLGGSIFIGGFRYPSITAALAVPFILALAAWGLEYLWHTAGRWPRLALSSAATPTDSGGGMPLQLLLVVPLAWGLWSTYEFSRQWYQVQRRADAIRAVVAALQTSALQWVQPTDSFDFIEPAVGAGLKLSPGFFPVQWRDREYPQPSLIANWTGAPAESIGQVASVEGIGVYQTNAVYAAVETVGSTYPCVASGSGGDIDVSCSATQGGRLVVQESMLTGWNAWLDGKPVALVGTQWLEVNTPSGSHTVSFRYRPWDVPLGLSLMGFGIISCLWLAAGGNQRTWFRKLSLLRALSSRVGTSRKR